MQSKWIWYRGDYEIYHGLKLHSRRQEYDVNIPPFWCQPTVYPTVSFAKVFEAKAEGYVKIIACGNGFVRFFKHRKGIRKIWQEQKDRQEDRCYSKAQMPLVTINVEVPKSPVLMRGISKEPGVFAEHLENIFSPVFRHETKYRERASECEENCPQPCCKA